MIFIFNNLDQCKLIIIDFFVLYNKENIFNLRNFNNKK